MEDVSAFQLVGTGHVALILTLPVGSYFEAAIKGHMDLSS